MLTKVFGSAVFGVVANTITVEVHVDIGIGYNLVGPPDNAIKESNFRIAAALQNNGYKIPGKKIILNMSPADLSDCNIVKKPRQRWLVWIVFSPLITVNVTVM